jgi:hypothetical protein
VEELSRIKDDKKDQIIEGLLETRRDIVRAMSRLAPDERKSIFLGTWTPMDLLAHLIGWDYANIEACRAIRIDKLPAFYSEFDRDWRSFNATLVERYGSNDLAVLISTCDKSQHALIDELNQIPESEFNRDRGLRFRRYKVTIARLLEAEIKDELEHLRQIEGYFELS